MYNGTCLRQPPDGQFQLTFIERWLLYRGRLQCFSAIWGQGGLRTQLPLAMIFTASIWPVLAIFLISAMSFFSCRSSVARSRSNSRITCTGTSVNAHISVATLTDCLKITVILFLVSASQYSQVLKTLFHSSFRHLHRGGGTSTQRRSGSSKLD